MPYDLFWWEGLDGSRVLAHTFNNPVGGYNAETGPRAIVETWKNFRGKYAIPESLLAFGYGDGGGGPTEEMLDRQRQFADFPVVPTLRPVKVADWFAEAHAAVDDEPRAAGLGRRDVSRAPPRHPDHPGPHQVPPPPRRTRADHRRDRSASMATLLGDADAAPRSSRTGACCCATSSTTSCPAPASARSTRRPSASSPAWSPKATASPPTASPPSPPASSPPATRPAVLVVNPDLSPRPLRLVSPDPLPGGQPVEGGSVLTGADTGPRPHRRGDPRRPPAPGAVTAGDDWLENDAPPRRDRRAAARSPASSTSAPAARPSPTAATRSGPTSTSRATGTPGTSRTTTPPRARRSPPPRSRSSSAARTAPRSASPAASATARSCRPTGSGPTPPASTSPPTSTGTSGASC